MGQGLKGRMWGLEEAVIEMSGLPMPWKWFLSVLLSRYRSH